MANYLNPKAPFIAWAMKTAEYATAHFSKWHMDSGRDVGDAPLPKAYGFDQSLVLLKALGRGYYKKGRACPGKVASWDRDRSSGWVNKWEKTGIYVDSTLAFIDRHKNSSFDINLWPGDVTTRLSPNPNGVKNLASMLTTITNGIFWLSCGILTGRVSVYWINWMH